MKPILKWVGGKTQIIEHVFKEFPENINNYHEPFLGGGSVLLELLQRVNLGEISVNNIYASDSNEALIGVYLNIQNNHKLLYKIIKDTIGEDYYQLRLNYNQITDKYTIQASAYFIILNKTCFRGLYRTGPNGFNVPYGNYKNPEIVNFEHLEEVHELIQGVNFSCCDFTNALSHVKTGDFVYLDPPYVPVNAHSFVAYNLGGFDKHELLFNILKNADYHYLMSNSDCPLVKEQFENIRFIKAKRAINSKNPGSVVNELLVSNKMI